MQTLSICVLQSCNSAVKLKFSPGIFELFYCSMKTSHSVSVLVSTSLAVHISHILHFFISGLLVVQKLLQVLSSQLAFIKNLFHREPEALRCQEDEWAQLEIRAKAFQQQGLEQEATSQWRILVCSAPLLWAI